MYNYRAINYQVMTDTKRQYESLDPLRAAIKYSISNQYMVNHGTDISQPVPEISNTKYIVSGKRSFEAAKAYAGDKKVAVLNFANNHSIGGAPYSAGAQEESLCRCSTFLVWRLWMRFSMRGIVECMKHIRLTSLGMTT